MCFTKVLKIVKIILNISIYKLKQEPSHEKAWESKNVFSFILKVDGFMLDRMSRGRLYHNFGAANVKTRSPWSLMTLLVESGVRFHHKNYEDCNVKVSQHKQEKKDYKKEPHYLKS